MLFSPLYATMIAIVILVFIIVVFGQVRIIFYVFVICIKDRLLDRHLCLNFYPCVIKVQSVSLSLSLIVKYISICYLEMKLTTAVYNNDVPKDHTIE